MKIVICGHRGVGKTSLLRRLQNVLPAYVYVDLDQQIEMMTSKKIPEIFKEHGETFFRNLELETYQSLNTSEQTVVAIGGGFPIDQIEDEDLVIFAQRGSDAAGRIFLDRPRLLPGVSPLQESLDIFAPREERFLARADFIYQMPEGMDLGGERLLAAEANLFSEIFSFVINPNSQHEVTDLFRDDPQSADSNLSGMYGRVITIEPAIFYRKKRLELFLYFARKLKFFVELRNDLLVETHIEKVLIHLSPQQCLFSFRRPGASPPKSLGLFAALDWALELGDVPSELQFLKEKLIVSCHEDNTEKNLLLLAAKSPIGARQKSSPLVQSFTELEIDSRRNFSFLPRSLDGRWKWYRLRRAQDQALNYYRYWMGSASDQATFFEMLAFIPKAKEFAAVLGDPVQFSFSPAFHHDFFYHKSTRLLPIRIKAGEWDEAFAFLKKLGLKWAAVTSPLKSALYASVLDRGPQATAFQSANTYFESFCENTDQVGLKFLLEGTSLSNCVVWGGGGTLNMIRNLIPEATFLSVRGAHDSKLQPHQVLWAAPRREDLNDPPESWRPNIVIDLNYNSNSPGIEYALKSGSKYISGLPMFIKQAQAQQQIWSQ